MNKKKFMYFALTAIVLSIILLVVNFITSDDDKDKPLFFDDYIHYNGELSDKGFKDLNDDNVVNTYYKEALFLGRNGTAYFYRDNFDKTFIKNSFVIELENVNDVIKLDNEIQGFIGAFQNYLHYEGSVSHSITPKKGKEINYAKDVIASVIEDEAVLTFTITNKEQLYTIVVYKEDSKVLLELSYKGELNSAHAEEMPENTNGVG